MMIRYVAKEYIPQALAMMEIVKEDFAGYKENEFLKALYKAIDNKEALLEEKEAQDQIYYFLCAD